MLAQADYVSLERSPRSYYYMPVVGRMFRRKVKACIDKLPGGQTVLDVGYGMGVAFLGLAQKYEKIVGVDIHGLHRDVARTFADTGIDVAPRHGSIYDLPLENDSVDAAVAISIHEHLPPHRQQRAFREVRRVLKPGGCYVVGVPGVHMLMTVAFHCIGWKINEDHICTHTQVLDTMGKVFDLDEMTFWPGWMPRRYTSYVATRGWKRDHAAVGTDERTTA